MSGNDIATHTDIDASSLEVENQGRIEVLELKYQNLFQKLNQKLNTIVYLKKIADLKAKPATVIDQEFEEIIKVIQVPWKQEQSFPNSDEVNSLLKLRSFIKNQIQIVKTNSLNLNYLQIILPTLKAIHHISSDASSSEIQIGQNLSTLYSKQDSDISIHHILNSYTEIIANNSNSSKIYPQILKLIQNELNQNLTELKNLVQTINFKENELKNLSSKITSDRSLLLEDQELLIKSQFLEIQKLWFRISIYSELLPILVMSSTENNWAEDSKLQDMVVQSGEIEWKMKDYQKFIELGIDDDVQLSDLIAILS